MHVQRTYLVPTHFQRIVGVHHEPYPTRRGIPKSKKKKNTMSYLYYGLQVVVTRGSPPRYTCNDYRKSYLSKILIRKMLLAWTSAVNNGEIDTLYTVRRRIWSRGGTPPT